MSSIVLAGGLSTRLGQDKVSLNISGETLLERTIRKLSQLEQDIILVLAQGQQNPLKNSFSQVRVTNDLYPGKGPLAGIYSGLTESNDKYNIAVACDMPFLSIDLLHYMINVAPKFDVVIPKIGTELEPLHAIYSTKCLDKMANMIEADNLAVRNLLEQVKVRYVNEEEIDSFDPLHLSWFNINTPDDLKKAKEILNREKENDPS